MTFFHQYDFLFKARLSFCAQEISEEEFVQIGDVDSQFQLYDENKKNAKEYFESLKKQDFPEDVFVIDQAARNLFLTKEEQKEMIAFLRKKGVMVMIAIAPSTDKLPTDIERARGYIQHLISRPDIIETDYPSQFINYK